MAVNFGPGGPILAVDQIWRDSPDSVIHPLDVHRQFKFNSKIQILHTHYNILGHRPSSGGV